MSVMAGSREAERHQDATGPSSGGRTLSGGPFSEGEVVSFRCERRFGPSPAFALTGGRWAVLRRRDKLGVFRDDRDRDRERQRDRLAAAHVVENTAER